MRALLLFLCFSTTLLGGAGQQLIDALGNAPLDAAECYRVRDLTLTRDEAQFFFTDGYLIFSKPAGTTPSAAFFSSDLEGGDAELLLLPPKRSERRTMSTHTGAPNLEEHFSQAAMVFSASVYRDLMAELKRNEFNKKSPEMGALLSDRWSPLIKTLGTNFGLRLATDLLSKNGDRQGFLATALSGSKLGAFNLVFDSRAQEQLLVGSTTELGFDIWSSFASRSFRQRPFRPEFSVADYRIETKMGANLHMRSRTRVNVTPAATDNVLPFEMNGSMRVTNATVDGLPAEVLFRERSGANTAAGSGGVFVLLTSQILSAGKSAEVMVEHEGKVIQDAGNSVFSVSARGSWYPNRGRQFARFDLTFRTPKEFDLVAAGDLLEDRVEGLERLTHWKTTVPIRLAGFNMGVYDRVRTTQGALTIEVCANRNAEASLFTPAREMSWSTPPLGPVRSGRRSVSQDLSGPPVLIPAMTPKMRLQSLAQAIGEVMEFYTTKFGPLALNRLEITPVPGRYGQGFPGMIYLSTLSYLEPEERAVSSLGERQKVFFTDLLYAHEAAHQWWGNIVTSADYSDDWLMESFANYSALLFLEKRKGTKAVDAVLEEYRLRLLEKRADGTTLESTGPVTQGTRLDDAWIPVVYGKGTWIIHMLRRQMGDASFFRMMGALRKEFEDKALGTEEFRLFCSRFLPARVADPKLESFFDHWVYSAGVPALKLTSTVKGKPGQWLVTGTLTQSEAGDEFAAEVPVEIQMGKGRSVTRMVTADADSVPFEFSVPAQPTKVSIDYRAVLHR